MTDLVERLRSWRSRAEGLMVDDCDEAADEIERLRADLEWQAQTLSAIRKNGWNDALEEAAKVATSFLVGDPVNGVPLRNPMGHEIAAAIHALKEKSDATRGA